MRGGGSQRSNEPPHPLPGDARLCWLRRRSARYQSRPTWNRNVNNAGPFMGTP